MNYTMFGKHRYIFLILSNNGDVKECVRKNISNKNVICKMNKLGISDCDRISEPYYAKLRKQDLNELGYSVFNKSGYTTVFNDERPNLKVKFIVIDMAQKQKHPLNIKNIYEQISL